MSQHILEGNPPITVVVRRSSRARKISLRVSQLDGKVTLTIPMKTNEKEALSFAAEKEAWLRRHLGARPDQVQITHGAVIPFRGQEVLIVPGAGRGVTLHDGEQGAELHVGGANERAGARVLGFMKQSARDTLCARSDFYAARLGREYSRLTIRDTRSRWGSCSSQKALMYSWRLIMAPPEVLDYVAAHEVAHLAQMNHSAAFWDQVHRIHGPYDAPRNWLRQNGGHLHRFRFGD